LYIATADALGLSETVTFSMVMFAQREKKRAVLVYSGSVLLELKTELVPLYMDGQFIKTKFPKEMFCTHTKPSPALFVSQTILTAPPVLFPVMAMWCM
jgi:hypothetical protein